MEKEDFYKLTDQELAEEKKKLVKSKLWHAIYIGFLGGILIFGVGAWVLSSKKQLGFLVLMLIPVYLIYKMRNTPNNNKDLEEVLKERKLG